jgi:hypothetical protein
LKIVEITENLDKINKEITSLEEKYNVAHESIL